MWTTGQGAPVRHGESSSRSPAAPVSIGNSQGRVGHVSDISVDYAEVWRRTLLDLDAVGLSGKERAFTRLCQLVGVLDQTAVVRAPDTYTKEFLETRVREQVHQALSTQLGHPVQLAVSVDESLQTDLGSPSAPAGRHALPQRHGIPQRCALPGQRGAPGQCHLPARRRAQRRGDTQRVAQPVA